MISRKEWLAEIETYNWDDPQASYAVEVATQLPKEYLEIVLDAICRVIESPQTKVEDLVTAILTRTILQLALGSKLYEPRHVREPLADHDGTRH